MLDMCSTKLKLDTRSSNAEIYVQGILFGFKKQNKKHRTKQKQTQKQKTKQNENTKRNETKINK